MPHHQFSSWKHCKRLGHLLILTLYSIRDIQITVFVRLRLAQVIDFQPDSSSWELAAELWHPACSWLDTCKPEQRSTTEHSRLWALLWAKLNTSTAARMSVAHHRGPRVDLYFTQTMSRLWQNSLTGDWLESIEENLVFHNLCPGGVMHARSSVCVCMCMSVFRESNPQHSLNMLGSMWSLSYSPTHFLLSLSHIWDYRYTIITCQNSKTTLFCTCICVVCVHTYVQVLTLVVPSTVLCLT